LAAGQQYDENQIYGCLMVPVDLQRAPVPDLSGRGVELKSWRRGLRWRLVIRPLLPHKKSAI
jgi:hypothetical protein